MALQATMYRIQLNVSDVDRGVYEAVDLRVARHPSESAEYMAVRVLAYALELHRDITFGRGVSTPDEPTVAVIDPTGLVQVWIEVGSPSAEKLHKVTKQAEDVAIYSHKDVPHLVTGWRAAAVHGADRVRVYEVDADFIAEVAEATERKCTWDVLRSEGVIYVTIGDNTFSAGLPVHRLTDI
ncbi:MAG: hypothetical protein ACI81R_002892 [Bradymonadia bacterium]|jgi:uncharacterized protein YaeQ